MHYTAALAAETGEANSPTHPDFWRRRHDTEVDGPEKAARPPSELPLESPSNTRHLSEHGARLSGGSQGSGLSGQVCLLDSRTLHLSHAIKTGVSMFAFQVLVLGFDCSSSEVPPRPQATCAAAAPRCSKAKRCRQGRLHCAATHGTQTKKQRCYPVYHPASRLLLTPSWRLSSRAGLQRECKKIEGRNQSCVSLQTSSTSQPSTEYVFRT